MDISTSIKLILEINQLGIVLQEDIISRSTKIIIKNKFLLILLGYY